MFTKVLERKGLVKNPASLGDYLRNRRLLQGISQREAASQCGTMREVYDRWERDEATPPVGTWPRLIRFLGRYPFDSESNAPALVLAVRRMLGLTQFALGRQVGAIASDVRKWETAQLIPDPVRQSRLKRLADSAWCGIGLIES